MTHTDLTTEQTYEQAEQLSARRAYVTGLRELAAFVESHPEIPLPWAGAHNAFVTNKSDLAVVAKACGGKWVKNATEQFFFISKPFTGGHSYEVNVSRESVCRKVVTGTRIEPAQPEREVEEFQWVCDEPLLAGGVK